MTAVRGFFGHLGFVWNRNLWRLLLVLVVLTALIASSGTVAFIQSVFGIIASIPAFALQLSFAAFYLIVQFGFLFWFLSRPRKYTVTPDDPQIGMSFDELPRPAGPARARQDHGRHPARRQGVRAARRRDAEGHAPVGRARAPARRSSPRCIAAEAQPAVHLHRCELDPRHVLGHDRADDHEALPRRARARPQVRPGPGSAAPASCSWTRSTRSA